MPVPLPAASSQDPEGWGSAVITAVYGAHFLLWECLFAYAIAGPDPARTRLGARARLVCLGCAIAVHAVIARMMYGAFWVDIRSPFPQVQGGVEIMYHGGDIAELLLAAALVAPGTPAASRTCASIAPNGGRKSVGRWPVTEAICRAAVSVSWPTRARDSRVRWGCVAV
ncbi:cytochrome c oxidase assembly protein [Streptomyces sp. NPDC001848]|uniref:cytochrome c oxidase assembly protein n=1 Tax=Streptomyces sp. NPDC001848 TaxID=3364618 RepID=UPI00369C63FC